ncbi:MAG: murein transglycosylase A [Rhodospirillales bacterium]|nr:murein transglycosylase A [Rhodospirillales bacterium]
MRRTASSKFFDLPAAAILVAALAACAAPVTAPPAGKPERAALWLEPAAFNELPGWKGDDASSALPPFLKSCEKLLAMPPDRSLGADGRAGRVADWLRICADAALIRPGNRTEAQYFFESRFTPYLARDTSGAKGLFTGYYEPELRGAWKQDATHRHPIYSRPGDLVSVDLGRFRPEWKGEHLAGRVAGHEFVPYATRADIEAGALKGRQLELLWVDDPIDAFFLHIQGSGRVVLPDGSAVRIGYAGRNGHRYTPIGRELVAMGALPPDKVSMQTIRAWLDANPLAGNELMERNKSFIFFRVLKEDGPVGAQDIPLTPGRSLAVDPAFVPLGIPIWLATTEPGGRTPLRRLVISQDTGSAIKGPVRGDLFVGFGAAAGMTAGAMKQDGVYYLLLPKKETS